MAEDAKIRAKIVLQNRESLLYLDKDGKWTPSIEQATRFEHVADANSYARKSELSRLDIVMSFGDPRYDVRMAATTHSG